MSSTRKKALVSAVTIGMATALLLLLVPSAACACMTPSLMFDRTFGVDSIDSSESELHAAILRRFPAGTPLQEIADASDALGLNPQFPHGLCKRAATSIRCHVDLGSSVFDVHRREMDFELTLDEADRLAAVRVRKHRWILGLRM